MRSLRFALALASGALGFSLASPGLVEAQEPRGPAAEKTAAGPEGFESRESLHKYYDSQYAELDRRRIADLTKLAAGQTGDQAEATYQELFNLAISRDMYDAAEKAAETYLSGSRSSPALRPVATLVSVVADASRGDYDQSLQGLDQFLKGSATDKQLEPTTAYAVGEAFLQRLIHAGRYDTARKVCEMIVKGSTDQAVKDHFASRLERIDRLGKPAPPISGTDIDGKQVSLADMKGKVVLIDFWATWCPPCVEDIPNLKALNARYGDKGFAILGVNLDALRDDVRQTTKATPVVRQFLVNYRVNWPNILIGDGTNELTRAYGVTEIPANFLVDRDGTITRVELSGQALEQAVAEVVGGEKAASRQP